MAAQIDSLIDENPPPVGLTEEQLDDHIVGVIMAEHVSLKRELPFLATEQNKLQLKNSKPFTTWVRTSLSTHLNLQEMKSVTP